MATASLLISTASSSDTTSYPSDAFTPAANDLIVVFVDASVTVAAGSMTSSVAGQTFTRITSKDFNNINDTAYAFVCDQLATAVSQTVTFDCTGDEASGTGIHVIKVTGMTRTGLSAVLQSATSGEAVSGTPAPVFAVACQTGNSTLGFVATFRGPAAMTPPTGWTELADIGRNTPGRGSESVARDSGFTGTTVTWGNTTGNTYAAIILELDTAVGGTPALSGSGDLSATGAPRPVVAAALSGSGDLSATGAPRPVVAAALSGSGTLSATGTTVTTVALSGSGTLSSTGTASPLDLTGNLFRVGIDPSFENFSSGVTTGWDARTNVATRAILTATPNGHGLKLYEVTATAAGGTAGIITSGFHQATAGTAYSFGFWASSVYGMQMFVDWYNASSAYISSNGVGLGNPGSGGARLNWNNVVAPANTAKFKVYVEALSVAANGTYWVDAFQYEIGTTATSYINPTSAANYVASPALSGSGLLSATVVPRPTQAVALSGSGLLSATVTPRPAQAVALSGSGQLSMIAGAAVDSGRFFIMAP